MKTTVTGEFDDHDHENHEKEIEEFHSGVATPVIIYESNTRKEEICVTCTKRRSNTHMPSSPPKKKESRRTMEQVKFAIHLVTTETSPMNVVLKYILSLNLAT